MSRLTDRQLREIAHDLLPCDHGRHFKLGEIAKRNSITRQTLNRLLNGRHAFSAQMFAYMEDMRGQKDEQRKQEIAEAVKNAEENGSESSEKEPENTAEEAKT